MRIFRMTLIFLIFVPIFSTGQEQFVQFLAPELENEEQCRWLESWLSEKPEIRSSRAENFSNNVLLFSEPGITLSHEQIEQWCIEAGYSITCLRSGIRGVDKILRLRQVDCEHPAQLQDE